MATQVIIPTTSIPAGTRALGPIAVPQGITSVRIQLDRSAWTDPALLLSLQLDLSLDNGVTWASTSRGPATDPFPVSCTAQGGIILDRVGQPATITELGIKSIPAPTSTTRQLRGALTVNQSCTLSGTLITG